MIFPHNAAHGSAAANSNALSERAEKRNFVLNCRQQSRSAKPEKTPKVEVGQLT